jgi:hypothetical protein
LEHRGAITDIANTQSVSVIVDEEGTRIGVLYPKTVMTLDEALVHAAYLVAATMRESEFQSILNVVLRK